MTNFKLFSQAMLQYLLAKKHLKIFALHIPNSFEIYLASET